MVRYDRIDDSLFADIVDYLQENLETRDVAAALWPRPRRTRRKYYREAWPAEPAGQNFVGSFSIPDLSECAPEPLLESAASGIRITKEETFSEMLLRLIDESGKSDPDVYRKAWVDRRVFSKIRSNPDYTPRKSTAVSFALALELDRETADELLMKAGYALSNGSVWDIIIRYCIEHKIFRLYDVNCILTEFDQPVLG